MTKTLFDHIKAITEVQDPNYFDTLDDGDLRSWSNFMIHRFLSMNKDWIELISHIQPYTYSLEPKQFYLCLIGLIPKGKVWLKYVKGKDDGKYEDWLIDLIKVDYQCSTTLAIDYLDIMYSMAEGKKHIKYICEKYGTDKKQINKLKLK